MLFSNMQCKQVSFDDGMKFMLPKISFEFCTLIMLSLILLTEWLPSSFTIGLVRFIEHVRLVNTVSTCFILFKFESMDAFAINCTYHLEFIELKLQYVYVNAVVNLSMIMHAHMWHNSLQPCVCKFRVYKPLQALNSWQGNRFNC